MEIHVGRVSHYFSHLSVAVLVLNKNLKIGDRVHFLGHTTDFDQPVTSLEINHRRVFIACPGEDVAMKTLEPVRSGDEVLRVLSVEALEAETFGSLE